MRSFLYRGLMIALCVCLVLPGISACADAYGYKIDVNAMKAREAADSFPVKVVLKKVVEEYFDTSSFNDPYDLLAFTVENGTDSVVTGFTLVFVAYDEDECTREITRSMPVLSSGSPKLNTVNPGEIAIDPGATFTTGQAVFYEKFTGVRAMISKYRLADGSSVANPAFTEWQNLAYGMVSDNSTELD